MNEESRALLRTDPIGWVTTRNRQLRAALMEGDEATVNVLKDDVAHAAGIANAEWWVLTVMGTLVEQSLKDQDNNSKEDEE